MAMMSRKKKKFNLRSATTPAVNAKPFTPKVSVKKMNAATVKVTPAVF
jgi:hypothetical protein